MRSTAFVLVAVAALLLASSAWALTGAEAVEQKWEDEIAAGQYQPASGNTTRELPDGFGTAPEGIYGATLLDGGSPAYWSWVRGRAEDDPTTKRWVHTSMWKYSPPYHSCFYCMNQNYDYMYIPRHHKYYMSAFRWSPPVIEGFPPQPVGGPVPHPEAGAAIVSGVYLTPQAYGNNPGEVLSQVVDLPLVLGLAW